MKRVVFLFLLLLAAGPVWAAEGGVKDDQAVVPGGGKTVRLLTVGNSFSRNATNDLAGIVSACGHQLVHTPVVVGGASLQLHWEKAQAFERDPQLAEGRYKDGKSLRELLQAEAWDVVTIQQASIKSHDVETYRPYAALLAAYIRKYAPGARLFVHQTWAYRKDDPRFTAASPKPGEPKTQQEMFEGLDAAYKTVARELDAGRIPTGVAMFLADSDPVWGYRPDKTFDPKAARRPALPDQTHSLHVGYAWKKNAKGDDQLKMDGHHASVAGQYVGACVFYETLYGESALSVTYVPRGLDAAYAAFLRQQAHRAVSGLQK